MPSITSLLAIAFYKEGASLRDVAWLLGISYPRAWKIINKYSPKEMRRPGSNRAAENMRPKDALQA